jgi:hypothetical protein
MSNVEHEKIETLLEELCNLGAVSLQATDTDWSITWTSYENGVAHVVNSGSVRSALEELYLRVFEQ